MHPTPDTVGDRSLDELAIRACTNLPRSVDESVGDDCRREDREGRGDTRDFVGDSFAGGHYLDECL